MRYTNTTRIAVLSTAAAVCLGTAGPASAHELAGSGSKGSHKTSSTPTLAQVQARIDSFIAKRQQQLAAVASKIAADPKLTEAQQADFAAKLAKQQAALASLKSAVDSASTVDAVHQAIKSAMAADGVHGFFGWCGFFGAPHPDGLDRDRDGRSPAHQNATVRARTEPGRATAPVNTARTVVVRTGEHSPTVRPARSVGVHRDWTGSGRHSGHQDGSYQGRHQAGSFAGNHGGHHR